MTTIIIKFITTIIIINNYCYFIIIVDLQHTLRTITHKREDPHTLTRHNNQEIYNRIIIKKETITTIFFKNIRTYKQTNEKK